MTDPKNRLKEILEKKFGISLREIGLFSEGVIDNLMIQAITKILKEFVYKDNLPNVEKIANSLYYDCPRKYKNSNLALSAWQDALDKFAKAIRKLIEGKK